MIHFEVDAIPAPGGSKKFVGLSKRTGRAVIVDMGGKKTKDWRTAVAWAAKQAHGGQPLTGPLSVQITFHMLRPKYHWRKNGELKPDAPTFHTVRPDALKLARSTEDAMTGIIYADDSQTVRLEISKRYADGPCGATIEVNEI